MAGVKDFTFEWQIENFSLIRGKLRSVPFIAFPIDKKAKWQLHLNLKFGRDVYVIGLDRVLNHKGVEVIHLEYKLTVVALDDSFEATNSKSSFSRDGSKNEESERVLLDVNDYLKMRRSSYLPSDTLTVRCWMTRDETIPVKRLPTPDVGPKYCLARTRFKVKRTAFIACMENFREFFGHEPVEMRIKSASHNRQPVSIQLGLTDQGMLTMRLDFELKVLGKWYTFRWYLLDESDTRTLLGYRESVVGLGKTEFPANLSKRYVEQRRNILLPNDDLSLHCELCIVDQREVSRVEKIEWNLPSLYNQWPFPSDILNLLVTALEKKKFTDVTVNTETNFTGRRFSNDYSIEAHSVVLRMRSLQCRTALAYDHGCSLELIPKVVYTTIRDYSLLKLALYFMYMDGEVNGISFKDTVKLFLNDQLVRAPLKKRLADHFERLTDLEHYCTALKLSLEYDAQSLFKIAQDFVLRNDQVVFGLQCWKELKIERPELVAKTMLMH
ncbi:speckle-type POZ protein B [Caerostris darwini]|uniref:Speckle-type POZ protein B n=1 Tax=Caerostris darwini TaxID=1538125 RepID=A0AAV4MIU3_9ARAC|nr:speckle-type POZ protein B [Caerostris darwini]